MIKAILVDLERRRIRQVEIESGYHYNGDGLDALIEAGDRDTETSTRILNGIRVTVLNACGAKDPEDKRCWGIKETRELYFSSALILATDSVGEWGGLYDQDCPLSCEEVALGIACVEFSHETDDCWSNERPCDSSCIG